MALGIAMRDYERNIREILLKAGGKSKGRITNNGKSLNWVTKRMGRLLQKVQKLSRFSFVGGKWKEYQRKERKGSENEFEIR